MGGWHKAVHMCGFDGIQGGNYFRGEPMGRREVEVRVEELTNGRAVGGDEITGEMITGGGDRVLDWIWRLYNMAFESKAVPEDWRSVVIVPVYKGKRERNKCKNYRGISLLSRVGKICAGTGGLTDDEQGGFREGSRCIDQIFTLKQISEKA